MRSAPWYPITPIHPRPLVQVRGIVTMQRYESELIIARGKPPHDNRWAMFKGDRPSPLPSGAKPCLWQPQNPDGWKATLPEPVAAVEPQMWSANQNNVPEPEPLIADSAQWWRDATRIRYEQPGEITPKMAEGRIMRAVATCGHGKYASTYMATFGAILARMMAVPEYAAYSPVDLSPRLVPLPADESDFGTAMSWFVALNPAESPSAVSRATWAFNQPQEIIRLRSHSSPLSYDVIGSALGVSGEAARRMYQRAIGRIVRIANGEMEVVDRVAEIRSSNLAWKRDSMKASA